MRPPPVLKAPILILSEHPPLDADQPATGLAVRHTRMAQCWLQQGCSVFYAWPCKQASHRQADETPDGLQMLPLHSTTTLSEWAMAHPDAVYVLGYWEFQHYLPASFSGPLILDYVAPRLLERQFEDKGRLPEDVARLIPLLSRCDEVWVGNEPQRDLMVSLMLLAGHSTRHASPVSIVPISAPVDAPPTKTYSADRPLKVFHGGRDWPWRDSRRWLKAIECVAEQEIELVDASQASRWRGFSDYLDCLTAMDVMLELSDENVERRYSQSFRASDALCRGVPLICNRFLPLARWVEAEGAGWLIDRPEQLPELLKNLDRNRESLAEASAAAVRLAGKHLDMQRNYAPLAEHMQALAVQERASVRKPLLGMPAHEPKAGWMHFSRHAARAGLHQVVHRQASRVVRKRPKPTAEKFSWVIVSRPDLFPTDHGAAVKIERTAWALSFHVDQVLLLTDTRHHYWEYRQGVRTRKSFPLWMRVPGWPRRFNRLRLTARGVPASNAFLYLPLVDRGLHLRLMWLIRKYPVEVVQGDFPAYAHPAVWASNMFGTRSLMVEHNIEFLRLAEQVPDLAAPARQWLERQEVDLANACDRVIAVSERDRDLLIGAGVQDAKVRTIPHGVDLQAFSQAEPMDVHTRYDIPADHKLLVFHGIYNYPPNLEAVEELSQSLLPALRARGVLATVLAIGPQPPSTSLSGVVFTGPADDLAGHLKAGDLAVIPLRDGGGTRMKILDDFAAGVPVVTTAKGMEGIPVEHGKQLLVVDDPAEMAELVIDLLNHPEKRRELSKNAHAWVSEFDWREIARRYVEFVRNPL